MESQNKEILKYLQTGKSLTPQRAMIDFGCMRLGARIHDLKARGHKIETVMISKQNRYGKKVRFASYRLEPKR